MSSLVKHSIESVVPSDGAVHVDGDVETLERSRLESGVVYDVEYNATVASEWSADNCASGDGKRFGPCEADDGIVV